MVFPRENIYKRATPMDSTCMALPAMPAVAVRELDGASLDAQEHKGIPLDKLVLIGNP